MSELCRRATLERVERSRLARFAQVVAVSLLVAGAVYLLRSSILADTITVAAGVAALVAVIWRPFAPPPLILADGALRVPRSAASRSTASVALRDVLYCRTDRICGRPVLLLRARGLSLRLPLSGFVGGATSADVWVAAVREQLGERAASCDARANADKRRGRAGTNAAAAFVALVLGVAAIQFSTAGTSWLGLLAAGAQSRTLVLAGQLYRLFTANFVHGGGVHLLGNCVLLLLTARVVGAYGGWAAMVTAALVGGLGGSVGSVLAGLGLLSVGSSSMAYALLGAVVVLHLRWRDTLPASASYGPLFWYPVCWLVAFDNLVNAGIVDVGAHIGGAVAGAAVSGVLSPLGPDARARFLSGRRLSIVTWSLASAYLVAGVWSIASGAEPTGDALAIVDSVVASETKPERSVAFAHEIAVDPRATPELLVETRELLDVADRQWDIEMDPFPWDISLPARSYNTRAIVEFRLGQPGIAWRYQLGAIEAIGPLLPVPEELGSFLVRFAGVAREHDEDAPVQPWEITVWRADSVPRILNLEVGSDERRNFRAYLAGKREGRLVAAGYADRCSDRLNGVVWLGEAWDSTQIEVVLTTPTMVCAESGGAWRFEDWVPREAVVALQPVAPLQKNRDVARLLPGGPNRHSIDPAPWVWTYDDGDLALIRGWKNGRKHGRWATWRRDGTAERDEMWKEGRLHGISKVFDSGGRLTSVTAYEDGRHIARCWRHEGRWFNEHLRASGGADSSRLCEWDARGDGNLKAVTDSGGPMRSTTWTSSGRLDCHGGGGQDPSCIQSSHEDFAAGEYLDPNSLPLELRERAWAWAWPLGPVFCGSTCDALLALGPAWQSGPNLPTLRPSSPADQLIDGRRRCVYEEKEWCDGRDNDCDGDVDEGGVCRSGRTRRRASGSINGVYVSARTTTDARTTRAVLRVWPTRGKSYQLSTVDPVVRTFFNPHSQRLMFLTRFGLVEARAGPESVGFPLCVGAVTQGLGIDRDNNIYFGCSGAIRRYQDDAVVVDRRRGPRLFAVLEDGRLVGTEKETGSHLGVWDRSGKLLSSVRPGLGPGPGCRICLRPRLARATSTATGSAFFVYARRFHGLTDYVAVELTKENVWRPVGGVRSRNVDIDLFLSDGTAFGRTLASESTGPMQVLMFPPDTDQGVAILTDGEEPGIKLDRHTEIFSGPRRWSPSKTGAAPFQ